MGKERKDKRDKHLHRVTVRFNDFEFDEISERAQEAKLPLAAYIRRQAFYNDINIHYDLVQDPEEIRKLIGEIGKIGSNLNQIARFFNTVGMHYGSDKTLDE